MLVCVVSVCVLVCVSVREWVWVVGLFISEWCVFVCVCFSSDYVRIRLKKTKIQTKVFERPGQIRQPCGLAKLEALSGPEEEIKAAQKQDVPQTNKQPTRARTFLVGAPASFSRHSRTHRPRQASHAFLAGL